MKIYNLDKFIAEDKKISIGGHEWIIPGDIDMLTWAELKNEESKGVDENKTLHTMHKILNLRQKVELEELQKILTPSLFSLFSHIMFNDVNEDEIDTIYKRMKTEEKKILEMEREKTKE